MKDSIQEIKRRVSMFDICNRYGIEVDRKGFASCVFHSEKTPSMKIYDNGSFHCFGCGATGDVIDFVRKYFSLDLPQAIIRINADFALGLPLGRKPTPREQKEAQRLENVRRSEKLAHTASYWIWWERYQQDGDRCAEALKMAKNSKSAEEYATHIAEAEYYRYCMGCDEDKMNEHRHYRA